MAFTNLYLIGGGAGSSDINAGSSIGAAQATTTNGNWNSGTGVFIAASGTPFAATTTSDYASVYVDAATVTTFVGKVTTVTSSTQITIDVATIKYGTAPSTSATGRSCTINGSWNSEIVLAATGLGTTTVPQSTKINIKQATYTITASRTISMAGATTTPLWFSGYHTTPGDLDNDTTNTLSKPIWAFNSTFRLTTSGTYQIWSGLTLTGAVANALWTHSGTRGTLSRVRSQNTSSSSAAVALVISGGSSRCVYSYFSTPTTATTTGTISVSGTPVTFIGCTSEGGGLAGWNIPGVNAVLKECIGLSNTGAMVLATTGLLQMEDCTISNCTSDGVTISGVPSIGSYIVGCLFRKIGSNIGINNTSGTNSANVYRACNGFYSCTTQESGFGDSPAFFPQTLMTDPCVSDSNLTPVPGSPSALSNGFPGIFENESFSSYQDIGAVAIAGGGGYTPQVFS